MTELRVNSYILILLLLTINLKVNAQDENNHTNSFSAGSLAIRTNIPTWLLAVPSIGLAYKMSNKLEIAVDGAMSNWVDKRNGKSYYWRTWNLSPQIRKYLNSDNSTYIGIQYSVGQYNISREQGNYWSSGIVIGKQYYAGKNLLVDIGLTLGYMKLSDREKYIQENNSFYRIETKKDRHHWGPTALSIRLARKVN